MDMLLTDDDITLTSDLDLEFVVDRPAIAQHTKMRLRTWLGESVYDTSEGMPFTQVIFPGGADLPATQFVIQDNVLRTPGVTGVTLDPLILNSATRELTVTGRMTSEEGPIDFTTIIGGTP